MRTAYDIKKSLDPMTMWEAVAERAAENREARRKAEREKQRKVREAKFLKWCTTHHRLKVLEGGLDA